MLPLVAQRILCPEAVFTSQVSSYCRLALSNLLDVINNSVCPRWYIWDHKTCRVIFTVFLVGRRSQKKIRKQLNSHLLAEVDWNKCFNHLPTSTIFWPTPAPCPEAGGSWKSCPRSHCFGGTQDFRPSPPLGWGTGAWPQQPTLVQGRASHHGSSKPLFGFVTQRCSRSTLVKILVRSVSVAKGDVRLCSPAHAWPKKVSSPAGAKHQMCLPATAGEGADPSDAGAAPCTPTARGQVMGAFGKGCSFPVFLGLI